MARSGTSLAASIFANQGYFVADTKTSNLQAADEYNPSGYWECSHLMDYNKEILAAAGFIHDNTWFHQAISQHQVDAIKDIKPSTKHINFIKKFNDKSPWLWKDPRLCYTLEYWWPLLNHQNTKVLHVTRNPDEIYDSFIRVSKEWETSIEMDKNTILDRIEKHVTSASRILNNYNIPHVSIEYSDYVTKPKEIVEKLNKFFLINLTVADLGFRKQSKRNRRFKRYLQHAKKFFKSLILSAFSNKIKPSE